MSISAEREGNHRALNHILKSYWVKTVSPTKHAKQTSVMMQKVCSTAYINLLIYYYIAFYKWGCEKKQVDA